jgi:hypothetical protein
MFYNGRSLTTVYASEELWDWSKLKATTEVFTVVSPYKSKIVGGCGTTYKGDSSTYARVDTLGTAGYFTDKNQETAGFAVYSTDDKEVILYGPGTVPLPGTVYDGRTVTAVDASLDSLDALAAYKTTATAIRMKGDVVFPADSMAYWLYQWTGLKSIDLSRLDTSGDEHGVYVCAVYLGYQHYCERLGHFKRDRHALHV